MSLVELLAHPACRLLTLALVHFLWQGLVVAAALELIVELGGIRRAAARYALSLIALVVMVLCPLVTLAWLAASDIPSITTNGAGIPGDLISVAGLHWPLVHSLEALQPYALAIWLAGVAAFGLRLSAGAIGLARLRQSRQLLPLKLAAAVERLGRRLSIEALPLVFLSPQVAEAMAIGVVRPLVLIPAAWITEMPLEMLEAVIAHELAHLRRRDLWVNLLQRVVETLLFYHPAVWWLSRRLRIERELCADELAVAATGRPLAYAQALEQVALRRRAEVRPALAAFLQGEQNMRLLERVRNVLGLAAGERSRLWPAGLVALALPLGLWITSLGLTTAAADDERERDKPAARRDRDDDDDDDKPAARKDAERKERESIRKEEAREKEFRKEKELAEKKKLGEFSKDDLKKALKDAESLKEGTLKDIGKLKDGALKDADKLKEAMARKIARKDGEKVEVEFTDTRAGSESRQIEELAAMVKRLSQQVERLQDEVNSLRGGKGSEGKPLFKFEGDKPLFKFEGDKPPPRKKPTSEASEREAELKERRAAEEGEARARKERSADLRKREESRSRAESEKEEAIIKARKLKENAFNEDAIRELIEKKQLEAREQVERAREAAERAREAVERAREKREGERKEIDRKDAERKERERKEDEKPRR